ncbi:response regulator [Xanthocytophaga agilis]|uniref:Response regulator n=1 Tax=Xanthocytophaga agilis TaxID=3048010 RepID=A0AAE3R643_9BACT|nr:response regulator [Xanthocytophaga agilis]MDJ1502120.1 response regulator [Xanthocytophaga agilis]
MKFSQTVPPGPIVIVNDDDDEQFILEKIFQELNTTRERLYFTSTAAAFEYLTGGGPTPFLIICDMILPVENGVEFKKRIDTQPQLKIKSIPFIFMSNAISNTVLVDSYASLALQGVFETPFDYNDLKNLIEIILTYWSVCKQPIAS